MYSRQIPDIKHIKIYTFNDLTIYFEPDSVRLKVNEVKEVNDNEKLEHQNKKIKILITNWISKKIITV